MPSKTGQPTPQETKFINAYVDSGNAQEAAKIAGYSQPRSQGYQALARPAVQEAVIAIQVARLNNDLLPLAVDALRNLLVNPRTPAGAVVQAAKLVMDRTLGSDEKGSKEPHEMSGDELARQLDRLRKEASERATPIIEHALNPGVFD